MHAGPVGDRGQPTGVRVQQQHLLLGRVAQTRLDQQSALVDPGHGADLDLVPGEERAVHREGAGGAVRGVGRGQRPPVGEAGRGARDQRVHPLRVRGAGQLPGAAGGRVGGEQQDASLEPVLDGQQDLGGGLPARVGDVRIGVGVPVEPYPGPVGAEHPQLDVGVGAARLGVGEVLGRQLRVRRVGEPAPLERGFVDAGGQQGEPVRGPPVAPGAAQFLGGGEFGEAPAGPVVGADPAARGDVQDVVGDVRGARAVGVGPRVQRGSGGRDLLGGAGAARGDLEESPVQREDGVQAVAGEGVRADAGGDEPGPLAQPALGHGEGAGLGAQFAGIGEPGLGAGGGVQDPERVEGVGGARRPEEPEQSAVVPEGEGARRAVGEAGRARGEPEEVIHDRSVTCEMSLLLGCSSGGPRGAGLASKRWIRPQRRATAGPKARSGEAAADSPCS